MSQDLERVVVINDRSVARGGATGLALRSAELLAGRGVPVTFLTGDSGPGDDSPGHGGAERAYDLACLGSGGLLERPLASRLVDGIYNRGAARFVAGWIDAHDTPGTVYHLHGWSQILSPAVFSALRRVGDRLVVSAHDFFLVCPNGGYANHRRQTACPLTPLGARCVATHCDKRSYPDKLWRVARSLALKSTLAWEGGSPRIATIHPAMHPWLERGGVPADSLVAVRNPVEPFTPERVNAEDNREILFVGRVHAEKGLHLAAAACRQGGLSLRVVGDGPMRPRLERDFPELTWDGWRSHGEIAAIARRARALVMPSLYPEPFGLVALEAMRSGLPLVCFADAFVGREAAGLGAAVLAEEKTVPALAAALGRLADDARVRELSVNAFLRSGGLASTPEEWADRLLSLYRGRLDRR